MRAEDWQSLGSDSAVWEGSPPAEIMGNMRKAAANLANISNRPLDVSFAIDQMEILNRAAPVLRGRLDLKRIGVGWAFLWRLYHAGDRGWNFPDPPGPKSRFT